MAAEEGSEEKEVLKDALDDDVGPSMTAVLGVVGVVGADGWVDEVSTGGDDKDMAMGARGVVGVVASLGYSLSPRPTLTVWKVVVMIGLLVRGSPGGPRSKQDLSQMRARMGIGCALGSRSVFLNMSCYHTTFPRSRSNGRETNVTSARASVQ